MFACSPVVGLKISSWAPASVGSLPLPGAGLADASVVARLGCSVRVAGLTTLSLNVIRRPPTGASPPVGAPQLGAAEKLDVGNDSGTPSPAERPVKASKAPTSRKVMRIRPSKR